MNYDWPDLTSVFSWNIVRYDTFYFRNDFGLLFFITQKWNNIRLPYFILYSILALLLCNSQNQGKVLSILGDFWFYHNIEHQHLSK